MLVIDQVLGVGDENFFTQCLEKILKFRRGGKTLACVSHSLGSLKTLCDRPPRLNQGRVLKERSMREVLKAYRRIAAPVLRASSRG
jgi:ABC-type polysaccharide/polyol phosphate transport system ATPase subunit